LRLLHGGLMLADSGCRENSTVFSDVADAAMLTAAPAKTGLPPAGGSSDGIRADRALVAVALVALLGLLVHLLLPPARPPAPTWMDALVSWQHPYPIFLASVLLASLLAATLQRWWHAMRSRVRHYAPLVAGSLAILCVWDFVTAKREWMPAPFFPGPDEVLGALIDDRRLLLISTAYSLRLLFCGYASGVIAGLLSGVAIGWFFGARYWGMPLLRVLGPVPATAFVPLVMVVFPGSLSGAAALIAFAVWFPVTMLTYSGIANVRRSHLDVARTLGAGRLYLILHVALPSALPNIFIGLFMGLGTASLTLPVAETLGVSAGLGWYVKLQQGNAEYAHVFAALAIMAIFFSALMALLFAVRDWMLRWQKGVIRW
jgi:NitT/TauT family transport system permease protein